MDNTGEAGEKTAKRRARVQPCRSLPARLTALAPEVRFFDSYERRTPPQQGSTLTKGKNVPQRLKPSAAKSFTARSGRTMARTGLRMMPTSPSSPLKIRTAGFPQYGFKAGCQKVPSREWRPRVAPSRFASLLRSAAFSLSCSALCRRGCAFRTATRAATPLYPRGPRSGLGCVVPIHHSLNRPHPPHSWAQRAFAASQLIRPAFAVRFRLGNPRLVPCFHYSFFLSMSSSTTPGSLTAACTQFLRRQRWPSPVQHSLGTPIHPTNPFRVGGTFRSFTTVRLRYNLLICSPS